MPEMSEWRTMPDAHSSELYEVFAACDEHGPETALVHEATRLTHTELRVRCLARARELEGERTPRLVLDADHVACILDYLGTIAAGKVALLGAAAWPTSHLEARLELLRAWQPASRAPSTRIEGRAPIDVVFTSGSSGRPRPIVHGIENYASSADAAQERIPFGPGDRWLLSLPLHHVGGVAILWRALRSGGAVATRRADDAKRETLGAALVRTRASHLSLVAKQLGDLLDDADAQVQRALTETRALLVGGGPVPPELIERAAARGLRVHCTWGMTETTAQVATTNANTSSAGAGRPLAQREVVIRDQEIHVRGPGVALGFVEDGALRPLVEADGFFATGDLGRLDGDGCLHILGRKDRRFVSGGENVCPEEIEGALLALPGVRAAVVVDVEDETWGARPVAFVMLQTVMLQTWDETRARALRETLQKTLPPALVPTRILELANGSALKPDYAALRALARSATRGDGERKDRDL